MIFKTWTFMNNDQWNEYLVNIDQWTWTFMINDQWINMKVTLIHQNKDLENDDSWTYQVNSL